MKNTSFHVFHVQLHQISIHLHSTMFYNNNIFIISNCKKKIIQITNNFEEVKFFTRTNIKLSPIFLRNFTNLMINYFLVNTQLLAENRLIAVSPPLQPVIELLGILLIPWQIPSREVPPKFISHQINYQKCCTLVKAEICNRKIRTFPKTRQPNINGTFNISKIPFASITFVSSFKTLLSFQRNNDLNTRQLFNVFNFIV